MFVFKGATDTSFVKLFIDKIIGLKGAKMEKPKKILGVMPRYLRPRAIFKITAPFFQRERRAYRKLLKITGKKWILYHQEQIALDKCFWMGVPILKNPLDAWIYQEIIHEVKPDVIIEIGSYHGGGTLFLAHLLDIIGKGHVISIDITRETYRAKHERIIDITGDSASEDTIARVAALCEGKTALVIQDANHSRSNVLKDIESYSRFVTCGSYFIIEDGVVELFGPKPKLFGLYPDGGPLSATEEFIIKNRDFIVDKERERYLITYNPKGFLKRIR